MDCFRDQWTSSGSKLSWKTINNCFASNNTFAACDGSGQAGHLSLGHWRQDGIRVGDNRCTGERTIPLYTLFYTDWASHTSCIETPSLIHYRCIVYSVPWSSFFPPEAAIRCNSTSLNVWCSKNMRLKINWTWYCGHFNGNVWHFWKCSYSLYC